MTKVSKKDAYQNAFLTPTRLVSVSLGVIAGMAAMLMVHIL